MQTKIYLTGAEPLRNPQVYARLYAAASTERKAKIDRYRFERDRLQSLCAESLLLNALQEYGYAPDTSAVRHGKNGKPYLADAKGFYFNLSHSGDYAMLAVSDAEIGCDIEQIRPVGQRVMKRVLTPDEYALLEAVPEADRDARFFRYWVAKESFMKACGDGLSMDPTSVRIDFGPPARAIGSGASGTLALWEGSSLSGYRYAVCRDGALTEIQTEFINLYEIAGGIANEH